MSIAPMLSQDEVDQIPRHHIAESEDHLAKFEPPPSPSRRVEQPSEQGRVSIRGPFIWTSTASHEARRICEDEIIDVGILDRAVGILPATIDQEHNAEED